MRSAELRRLRAAFLRAEKAIEKCDTDPADPVGGKLHAPINRIASDLDFCCTIIYDELQERERIKESLEQRRRDEISAQMERESVERGDPPVDDGHPTSQEVL